MDPETGGVPKEAIDFDANKARANFNAALKKDFDKPPAEEALKKLMKLLSMKNQPNRRKLSNKVRISWN